MIAAVIVVRMDVDILEVEIALVLEKGGDALGLRRVDRAVGFVIVHGDFAGDAVDRLGGVIEIGGEIDQMRFWRDRPP